MAWTAPATVVSGQLMVAPFWNIYVRDNESAIRSGGVAIASQAANDLIYAGSSTQWARLAAVSGQVPRIAASVWSLHNVIDLVYPVGSVYRSTKSTNPGTLFGVGTWVAYAVGKTLVGIDAGQTEFDTVEETGGAKTVTLGTAEMPSHTHPVTDPGHNHLVGTALDRTGPGSPKSMSAAYPGPDGNYITSTNTTGITMGNTGGGGAHNNLNPYQVAYVWKRTA